MEKVTVIIPVYKPQDEFFNQLIPMLKKQSLGVDIFIIFTEKEYKIEGIHSITIPKKDFNHANTRNIALAIPSDYYLFMTQDAIPYDEFLVENLVKSMKQDKAIVLAYARQIPKQDASPSERFARETNYPEQSYIKSLQDIPTLSIKTFFSSNSCAIYDANYFKKEKGFQKNLFMSEDMEFAARAILKGYKVAYSAEAKVYHSHNLTLLQLYKRYYQIGAFFAKNYWILESLKQYSSINKVGFNQSIKEIKTILSKYPLHIPKVILQIVVKYFAYKQGFKSYKNG